MTLISFSGISCSDRMSKNILASLWMLLLLPTEIIGQCTKPATSENAVIHQSDILKDTFDTGSAVRLACHPGYEPTSGSPRKLKCDDNNQWTPGPEKFTCQKKSCGHPGELSNGHYEFPEGVEFGASITAVCNTGHFAIGEKQRRCLGDGQWDGGNFVCEVVKCEPPKPIPNGQPRPPINEMYEYGQTVQYDCNRDYTMLGASDSVHCLENGSWSDVPRCAKVVCIRLDILNARRVEGGSGPYGYKYTLRYECNVGYKMSPDGGKITCLEHGWSSTPNCTVVKCPNPGTTNATITDESGGPYKYGAILTYKCQAGHTLVGSLQLKCGSDGQWSSKPPTCQALGFPQPVNTNAIYEGPDGPYRPGDILKYKCTHWVMYKLVGCPQLKCGSDGQWSSKPPTCQVRWIILWIIIIVIAAVVIVVIRIIVYCLGGCNCRNNKTTERPATDAEVVVLNPRPVSDTVNILQSADSSKQAEVVDPEPAAGP